MHNHGPYFACEDEESGTIRAARSDGYNRRELGFNDYDLTFRLTDNGEQSEDYTVNVPIVGGNYFEPLPGIHYMLQWCRALFFA